MKQTDYMWFAKLVRSSFETRRIASENCWCNFLTEIECNIALPFLHEYSEKATEESESLNWEKHNSHRCGRLEGWNYASASQDLDI